MLQHHHIREHSRRPGHLPARITYIFNGMTRVGKARARR
jgi:hypothetical protein